MVDIELEIGSIPEIDLEVLGIGEIEMEAGTPYVGSGTKDYERLENKPRIEEVELIGNKSFGELGMDSASYYDIAMLFN